MNRQALARRVRERYLDDLSARPELPTLAYTFDMPFAGDGWYAREGNGARTWRFTGPGARATLYFPRLSGDVRTIVFDLFHAVTAAHAETLEVALNGIALPDRVWDGTRISFAIPLGATHARPYTHLEIETRPPVRPAGDDRTLGIAFFALTIA